MTSILRAHFGRQVTLSPRFRKATVLNVGRDVNCPEDSRGCALHLLVRTGIINARRHRQIHSELFCIYYLVIT